MSKCISSTHLSDSLTVSECTDGWWLWDGARGMNLSMRAKTRDSAFVQTITYYQQRLTQVEGELKELRTKVEAFVGQVHECPDEEEN